MLVGHNNLNLLHLKEKSTLTFAPIWSLKNLKVEVVLAVKSIVKWLSTAVKCIFLKSPAYLRNSLQDQELWFIKSLLHRWGEFSTIVGPSKLFYDCVSHTLPDSRHTHTRIIVTRILGDNMGQSVFWVSVCLILDQQFWWLSHRSPVLSSPFLGCRAISKGEFHGIKRFLSEECFFKLFLINVTGKLYLNKTIDRMRLSTKGCWFFFMQKHIFNVNYTHGFMSVMILLSISHMSEHQSFI